MSSQASLEPPTGLLVPITDRVSPIPLTPVTPAAAAAGGSGTLRLMDSSDDMSLELDDTK